MITTNEMKSTLRELKEIPVIKLPGSSNRWKGIQHGELVETIYEKLEERDISIKEQSWYPNGPELQRLNGSMQLEVPGVKAVEGTSFSLGIQHSNLGDHALKFAVGAKIFICSNGMVAGDYTVKRRHTIGVDLMESIGIGIDTYVNRVKEIPTIINNMKETEMENVTVDRALMKAGREHLISWSRIGQVDKEYRKPTFGEFNQKTAWSLYNAFTYTLQKMPAHYHIKSMNRFRKIITEKVA